MTPAQHANVAAGQLLITTAQKISGSLDTFSGWLLAGSGAALAFFIASLDTVSDYVAFCNIKYAAVLLLISAVVAVLEKLLATFIGGGAAAGVAGAALGKDLRERGIDIDLTTFLAETKRALYWPGSFFANRAFAKIQAGDFAGPGRMYVKLAQLQALVVIIQAALTLAAAAAIVSGLAV